MQNMYERIVKHTVVWSVSSSSTINVTERFIQDIQRLIDNGWQPFGTPFVVGVGVGQAMVKYAKYDSWEKNSN